MGTGKSLSETIIFASTNPQYENRLFLTFRTIFVHNMLSPWSAKKRASDKDLPVSEKTFRLWNQKYVA